MNKNVLVHSPSRSPSTKTKLVLMCETKKNRIFNFFFIERTNKILHFKDRNPLKVCPSPNLTAWNIDFISITLFNLIINFV